MEIKLEVDKRIKNTEELNQILEQFYVKANNFFRKNFGCEVVSLEVDDGSLD